VHIFVVCAGTRVRVYICQNVCCRGFVNVPACVFVCWLGSVVVVCVCVCVYVCARARDPHNMGWLRLVGFLQNIVSFVGLFYKRDL